jgi:hypothetical protein
MDAVGTFDHLRRLHKGLRGWFAAVADCCEPDVLLCDCVTGEPGEICLDCA